MYLLNKENKELEEKCKSLGIAEDLLGVEELSLKMIVSLGKNDGGPTVPTTKMSRRARSLAFPPSPPIDGLNFYQATRTLRADHPKCGPAIVTSSFSGYGKVE